MLVVLRYIIYSAVIVGMAIGCINVFRNHPEVQFAFLMPGLFIIMYSLVRDDIFRRHASVHLVRSGGTFKGK
ncbi:hypothetical protein HQ865_17005 [Mucilaginibacter mali]|uniref:Uncharacterized protein n=1 Tax=Mucilaginibacter mali TaxID=2740462 RepID=A0A7D4QLM3_9SPHI|nr:hypothetical protein [Mucilaginibacter mali]QKJ31390.1 hypothetical protein HQ865_17005 [Mucilaginibacter mali]